MGSNEFDCLCRKMWRVSGEHEVPGSDGSGVRQDGGSCSNSSTARPLPSPHYQAHFQCRSPRQGCERCTRSLQINGNNSERSTSDHSIV